MSGASDTTPRPAPIGLTMPNGAFGCLGFARGAFGTAAPHDPPHAAPAEPSTEREAES